MMSLKEDDLTVEVYKWIALALSISLDFLVALASA
jgi:hypothetical protein